MELKILNKMNSQTSSEIDDLKPRLVDSQGPKPFGSVSSKFTSDLGEDDEKNPKYNAFRAWTYSVIHMMGTIYFGYAIVCMNNLAKPVLQHNLGFHGDDFTSLLANQNVSFGVGKVISSIFAGACANKFGRRNLLMFAELINIMSFVLFLFPNEWCFLGGRASVGMYLGIVTCLGPRMVNECFPVRTRGKAVAINSVGVGTGVCIGFSIGKAFGTGFLEDHWNWFFLTPSALCFLRMVLIVLFYNHKTPKQLVISAKSYDDVDVAVTSVLERYYESASDIKAAKSEFRSMMAKGLADSGFCSLLKYNLANKKTR
jgi:MFS family permease